MNAFLWSLFVVDICIGALTVAMFFLRQRPYTILAVIFSVILVLVNVVMIYGPQNPATIWFPAILFVAVILITRPFMPRPRVTLSPKAAKAVFFILLFCVVLAVLALLFFILLTHM
jgi:hypothetical protein